MAGDVGQGLSNMIGALKKDKGNNGNTPPPVPGYSITINGQAEGSYSIDNLTQLFLNGKITKDTLLWKKGMSDWKKAGEVEEIADALSKIPPVPHM